MVLCLFFKKVNLPSFMRFLIMQFYHFGKIGIRHLFAYGELNRLYKKIFTRTIGLNNGTDPL